LAQALFRLFPALTPQLVRSSTPGSADQALRASHDARQLAFSALRFVFEGLARTRPIVLCIDDLQWADEDSGTLLRELLRPPGYGLLVIACYRAEDRDQSACLRVLDDESSAQLDVPRRALSLGPLDASSGLELVRESSGARVSAEDPVLGALLESAEGSPFLLQEVALFLKNRHAGSSLDPVSLDELLRLRTQALPEEARKVLEVFAIAGAPLEQDVALRAAGLAPRDRATISDLERLSVLRTTAVRGRFSEIYHHRIREEVIRQLERPARLQRHRDIGNAVLASARPNPLLAVDHFEAAEDLDLLRRYIVPAANQAFNGLAFERAARLYERAGALGVSDMLPHELRTRRAVSLSNAGRGHEAALAFQDARAALASHTEADLEQHLGLAKNAAEHFIQSGRYAEGLAVFREVMNALEIPLPRSRSRALLEATWLRFAMVARGVRLPAARDTAPSARELLRFDTLWSTSIRVSMIDYTLSSYGVARCAVDALALGEPSRMACALALEATNLATLPLPLFGRRADELFKLAERLLESAQTRNYDRAFLLGAYGVTACFRSDFAACVRFVDQARALLEAAGEAHHYEFALWQTWAMIGLSHLGEIQELKRRAEALRKIGSERGDRFALQMTDLGRPSLAWLADDRADYALELANRALSWAPSDYNTQHYWHFTTTIECKLYLGDFEAAWGHVEATWPAQQRNHFLKVIFAREELWLGRARAALGQAALLSKGSPSRPSDVKRAKSYLDVARSSARQIDRAGLRAGKGWARLLEAVAAHHSGDEPRARAHLSAALRHFDEAGMKLYREASRYCLGMLEGDTPAVEHARTWMRNQGVLVPEAMVRMMAPGMPGTTPPPKL
ncbi:MAG: AAA family ATPase, partial [Myxococcota bacterium]|nr:AAA family ATPase [Myxococcota bacterium]